MKTKITLLAILLLTGCRGIFWVPNDFMGKPTLPFSSEAIQYRKDERARKHAEDLYREQQLTNSVAKPQLESR